MKLDTARMQAAQAVSRSQNGDRLSAAEHVQAAIDAAQGDERVLTHLAKAKVRLQQDGGEARYHLRKAMSLIDARQEHVGEFQRAGELATDGDGR
jgi:hypothetical protein